LASLGAEGIEKLTLELNKYFDALIGEIYRHGGDIIKFAGDAVLVLWPAATQKGLPWMVCLACQCARALLDHLDNYSVEGKILRLHIGIGAGEVGGVHVGGVNGKHEFFISGQVLEQVSACEKQAQPGETFVSAIAWLLVEKGILNGSQQKGSMNYRLDSVRMPVDLPPPVTLPLLEDMRPSLESYVQDGVLKQLYSGNKKWLAELRTISVLFANLTSPYKDSKLDELHTVIRTMQTIVYKYEGVVRQFMIDDKGSVFIAGFGLPPFSKSISLHHHTHPHRFSPLITFSFFAQATRTTQRERWNPRWRFIAN
jgi:hypothetical protein